MAGRPRKPIEEKIAEKEELVSGLQRRLKAEQSELDALYNEKRLKELENLNELIVSAGLDVEEAAQALADYISLREQEVS